MIHVKDTQNFFDHLVTVDECWVYQYDPEIKYQSKEWMTDVIFRGSPTKSSEVTVISESLAGCVLGY